MFDLNKNDLEFGIGNKYLFSVEIKSCYLKESSSSESK